MQTGIQSSGRRLGRIAIAFLLCIFLYVVFYLMHANPALQFLAGFLAVVLGLIAAFRLANRGMKRAIWRLRNRLMAAYLFIAVVPIVLILTLLGIAGYVLIGQMAIYLVNQQLDRRVTSLTRQADIMARVPTSNPETAARRFAQFTRREFPVVELRMTGEEVVSYPADTQLSHPPPEWKNASGLIIKNDGAEDRLYVWAHAVYNGNEVTVLAPLTHELLSSFIPGLGDVNFTPVMGHIRNSHLPAPVNSFDFRVEMLYPVLVPRWDSPKTEQQLYLLVNTRLSAVLGIIFGQNQKMEWGERALSLFIFVAVLFLLVELVSLVAGVQLSRSITGAVHELYEGTQHVKEGDFAYRVPVKGNDQLADLTTSFNTMTQNLKHLIVVAKEKERLESELEIAREVQNQLFPKDVPFTKTLELKGVCNPARMVSGDYYDFMSMSDSALAFAIGDVAGKGISAALLMATIQSTMRTQLSASNNGTGGHALSAARMVTILNQQLYATTAPEKYATFYLALYSEATHSLTYTNAGHLAPILLRGSNLQMLGSTGTIVGAFPHALYEEKTVSLEHGDVLVAYTDGIVEPENAYGEMFGDERLKDLLVKFERADSSEIIARAMEAVVLWTGSSELQDDMTMVIARRI